MIEYHLKILSLFCDHPGTWYYPREIAMLLTQTERSVYNRLDKLVEAGFVERNKKMYRLDTELSRKLFARLRINTLNK